MSKIGDLRKHLLDLYEEHEAAGMLPTSLQFLWYELVRWCRRDSSRSMPAAISRPGAHGQRQPKQDVIDALTDLRESGEIPWEAIVDETRSIDDFTGFWTIAEGVDAYMNASGIVNP